MSTFITLQSDITALIGKSNVSGAYVMLARLAQDALQRKYSPKFLTRLTNLTPLNDIFQLPVDCLRIKTMRMWSANGGSTLMGEVPETTGRLRSQSSVTSTTNTSTLNSSGRVLYWREISGLCHLVLPPESGSFVELDYVVTDAYLVNDGDANLWLVNAYDIMLWMTAAEAMVYIVDTQRHALYKQQAFDALVDLQHNDVADEVSGREFLLKGGYDA